MALATASGLYHFLKMPFRLHRAATFFQRVMDQTLWDLHDCAVAYIDDILVFSPLWEMHCQHLHQVLEALRRAGLSANRKKSHLGFTTIQSISGLQDQWGGKFEHSPVRWSRCSAPASPLIIKTCSSSLASSAYYWRLIPWIASLATPLMVMLKGQKGPKAILQWEPQALTSF